MFDDQEFPARSLANPSFIQQAILTEQNLRLGGNFTPADPNNAFMSVLEANSSIVAQVVGLQESVFQEIYPVRATTMEDLYRFMSDFDYAELMAKPAQTVLTLIFDRNELASRAPVFNANYNKLIIPETTVVSIGARQYGIYYPVEIRINSRTGNFLVAYDTTRINPLHAIASNQVDFVTYSHQGIDLIKITLPIYQFTRTRTSESVVIESGFNVSYDYTDKFMAARVFTLLNNKWNELTYTLSEDVYDRAVATAKLKLLTDEQRVQVSIPQIYLTTGQIGSQVRVEIYTTKGKLDVPITEVEGLDTKVNFNLQEPGTSAFSAPLDVLSLAYAHPEETRVLGGSDPLSFAELQRRVIYGLNRAPVPVTPLDLQNFIRDNGFVLTRYLDNVDERTYYANAKLHTNADARDEAPVTVADIVLTSDMAAGSSTILEFVGDSITILPTTVFKYNATADQVTPLTDLQISNLGDLPTDEYIATLNSNTYTRQPFHLVVYTGNEYPLTKTFNLNDPSVTRIQFVRENVNAVAQMLVSVADMIHLGNGTGGYTLRLGVTKTKELADVSEDNIFVVLTTVNRVGRNVYARATKTGSTDALDIYTVDLPTNYHISSDGYIRTTLAASAGEDVASDLPLTATFDVHLMVAPSALPPTGVDDPSGTIPTEYAGNVELIHQTIDVTFGEDLSSAIFNITNAIWSAQTFATHTEIVYHTYARDVYETDENGGLVYTVGEDDEENPIVVLNKLHEAGDVVLDEDDEPVIKFEVGDLKRDGDGNPIVLRQRSVSYYIQSLMLDARLYASQLPSDVEYLTKFPSQISAYVSTVNNLKTQLLELTNLYFKPIRTIGAATFSLGSGAMTQLNLGLGFTIRYYVTEAVIQSDALKDNIVLTTARVLDNHMEKPIISITDITSELRASLQSEIQSVDAIGINGTTVQTLIVTEPDANPMVGLRLAQRADGSIILEKDITIEWRVAK